MDPNITSPGSVNDHPDYNQELLKEKPPEKEETSPAPETPPVVQPVQPPPLSELEQTAMKIGWKPQDQMADQSLFKSAEQFIIDGQNFTRQAQIDNRELKQSVKQMQEQLTHVNQNIQNSAKQTREEKISDIRDEIVTATEEANVDRVNELIQQMNDLQTTSDAEYTASAATQPAPAPTSGVTQEEVIASFRDRNKWFDPVSNPQMYDWAVGYERRLNGEGKSLPDALTIIEKESVQMLAGKNGNNGNQVQYQPQIADVATPSGRMPPTNVTQEVTFDELPAESKTAYQEFVNGGLNITKAEWAKQSVESGYVQKA